MKHLKTTSMRDHVFLTLVIVALNSACATNQTMDTAKYDPRAAEKARPYLANHYGLDFRTASTGGVCAEPKVASEWKTWVQAAGACVQKQDWALVEKMGSEMASRHTDSPWGAYFLGLAAAQRGEMLRAHWMLDLAEKKAGGSIGLVRYEKARLLEKEEGVAEAAKEMKEAVRVDSTLLPALLWLAQVHHRDRMNAEAERYYRGALALKSDLWAAVAGLADILVDRAQGPEAVELLNRAVALRPEVAETRVKLAFVYETLTKEPARAVQTLRELRVALEKGRARGKVSLDSREKIDAKIKMIEQTMKPEPSGQAREREPAQDKTRSATETKKGG